MIYAVIFEFLMKYFLNRYNIMRFLEDEKEFYLFSILQFFLRFFQKIEFSNLKS